MIFKSFHKKSKNIKQFEENIKNKKHNFVLIYLEGCHPCNLTKPEWKKIKGALKNNKNTDVSIMDIDESILASNKPNSFPTIRYISNGEIEEYKGERNVDAFVSWIKSKVNLNSSNRKITRKSKKNYNNKTKRR
jgi:hypothetical protein